MELLRHIKKEPNVDSAIVRAKNWIGTNLESFIPAIQQYILLSEAKSLKDATGLGMFVPRRFFDRELRLPEEMPICKFWNNFSESSLIPQGFRIVEGSVLIDNATFRSSEYRAKRSDHQYLEDMDGSNVIVDHCPAQFFKGVSFDVHIGARLAAIVERAGDLTSVFTNEAGISHTFLIGTRAEIENRLGLRYDTQPRYES